jgi:hypothetical protein
VNVLLCGCHKIKVSTTCNSGMIIFSVCSADIRDTKVVSADPMYTRGLISERIGVVCCCWCSVLIDFTAFM